MQLYLPLFFPGLSKRQATAAVCSFVGSGGRGGEGGRLRSCSLAVFGNGRTHTGELEGSGGSRLANYRSGSKLRQQRREPERSGSSQQVSLRGHTASEWLPVMKGGLA